MAADEPQLAALRQLQALVADARRSAAEAAALTPDAPAWGLVAEGEFGRVEGSSQPEHWRAAIAAWERLDRPYVAAYCRWRCAETLLAAGASSVEAAVPAREAHRVARWLGARLLQRELELLAQRARLDLLGLRPEDVYLEAAETLGLTAREGEVLHLLARGYTNREIAAELTISIKTASVHVSHILSKLNVSSRVEAAAVAHRLAPRPAPDGVSKY